jgi:hypothetical protein
MCYSKESSLYTSTISFVAIVYLLSSGIPHFQWLGVTLFGWCAMQFAEYLLWSENPRKECTENNKLITATLIPLALFLQGVSAMLGAFFVYPANVLNPYALASVAVSAATIYAMHFYNADKMCTVVTKEGHLNWSRRSDWSVASPAEITVGYYYWAFVIFCPLLFLWNRSRLFLAALVVLPALGFFYGQNTDSGASIWCYYTSWSSIIAAGGLALKQAGIYDVLRA